MTRSRRLTRKEQNEARRAVQALRWPAGKRGPAVPWAVIAGETGINRGFLAGISAGTKRASRTVFERLGCQPVPPRPRINYRAMYHAARAELDQLKASMEGAKESEE